MRTYRLVDPSNPEHSPEEFTLRNMVEVTDWTDENLERIVALNVGESFQVSDPDEFWTVERLA